MSLLVVIIVVYLNMQLAKFKDKLRQSKIRYQDNDINKVVKTIRSCTEYVLELLYGLCNISLMVQTFEVEERIFFDD